MLFRSVSQSRYNGDCMVVSWQYYYDPGKPAPDCANPSSVLYAMPDEEEEFGIDGAVIVCATDENGVTT